MEHLNQEELKLLDSVIAEDGMEASKSVVHDPKKERAIVAFWLEKCKGCFFMVELPSNLMEKLVSWDYESKSVAES